MEALSGTSPLSAPEAGMLPATVSAHLPILRRCVDARDPAMFVAACLRPDHPRRGEHVLLLTRNRLVVTWRSRLTGRIRLHLNAGLRELIDVGWTPDPHRPAVELAATASDGLRERFWLKLTDRLQVGRVDLLLADAFSPRLRLARPTLRHPRVPARHCG